MSIVINNTPRRQLTESLIWTFGNKQNVKRNFRQKQDCKNLDFFINIEFHWRFKA